MNLFMGICLFAVGFEAGGGATYQKGFGEDIEDFEPVLSWYAALGIRDLLPGIGFDVGMRGFGVEKKVIADSLSRSLRWEGYFFEGTAVFDSWPYVDSPFGLRLRVGGGYVPWRMLGDGEVITVPGEDESGDTVRMEANDWEVVFGGGAMARPVSFLILETGVNHRHIFSMDQARFGEEDRDERFLEVYLGARVRF